MLKADTHCLTSCIAFLHSTTDGDFTVPVRGRDIARPRRGRAQSQHADQTSTANRTAEGVIWHQDRAGNEWADDVDAQHGHDDNWHGNWLGLAQLQQTPLARHRLARHRVAQCTAGCAARQHEPARQRAQRRLGTQSTRGREDPLRTAWQALLREFSRPSTVRNFLHRIAWPIQSWAVQQAAGRPRDRSAYRPSVLALQAGSARAPQQRAATTDPCTRMAQQRFLKNQVRRLSEHALQSLHLLKTLSQHYSTCLALLRSSWCSTSLHGARTEHRCRSVASPVFTVGPNAASKHPNFVSVRAP